MKLRMYKTAKLGVLLGGALGILSPVFASWKIRSPQPLPHAPFVSFYAAYELSHNDSLKTFLQGNFFDNKWSTVSQLPWRWRGADSVGSPMQSFTEAQYLGDNFLLLETLGRGLDLLDVRNGRSVWSVPVEVGVASRPLVLGASIIFAGLDGTLRRIRRMDAREEWRHALPYESMGILSSGPEGLVYVTQSDDSLSAVDEKTGQALWTYKRPQPQSAVYWSLRGQSFPKFSEKNNLVMVGFSDGALMALEAKTGKALWERKFEKKNLFTDVDTPVAYSEEKNVFYVSVPGRDLIAIRPIDGQQIWAVSGGGFSEPVLVESENALYTSSFEGKFFKVQQDSGNILWSVDLGYRGLATKPVMLTAQWGAVGTSHGGFFIFDRQNGQILWSSGEKTGSLAPLSFDGKRIFYLSSRNSLYVYTIEGK